MSKERNCCDCGDQLDWQDDQAAPCRVCLACLRRHDAACDYLAICRCCRAIQSETYSRAGGWEPDGRTTDGKLYFNVEPCDICLAAAGAIDCVLCGSKSSAFGVHLDPGTILCCEGCLDACAAGGNFILLSPCCRKPADSQKPFCLTCVWPDGVTDDGRLYYVLEKMCASCGFQDSPVAS